jgi:hypothetical protein
MNTLTQSPPPLPIYALNPGRRSMATTLFVVGFLALGLSGLAAAVGVVSPTTPGFVAEGIAGVIGSLLLIGVGERIDKLHKIEFHLSPK